MAFTYTIVMLIILVIYVCLFFRETLVSVPLGGSNGTGVAFISYPSVGELWSFFFFVVLNCPFFIFIVLVAISLSTWARMSITILSTNCPNPGISPEICFTISPFPRLCCLLLLCWCCVFGCDGPLTVWLDHFHIACSM